MTLSLLAPIAVLWTAPLLAQAAADERPLLSSMEELPAARYELELPVLELVAAAAQLRALADAVAADLAALFEQYRLAPALEKELAQRALAHGGKDHVAQLLKAHGHQPGGPVGNGDADGPRTQHPGRRCAIARQDIDACLIEKRRDD